MMARRRLLLTALLLTGTSYAFTTQYLRHSSGLSGTTSSSTVVLHAHHKHNNHHPLIATALLGLVLSTASPLPAGAYDPSDYASETVTQAVQSLQQAKGSADSTFQAYENIASIITEGKGVGGSINYQGIQLDRGYIADEDTAIYNPGLTLLTESEKERLVEAVIDARKAGLSSQTWTENNQVAYEFLKEKLDPLHMVELKGYLSIVPIYGAILYLAVLAAQQFARNVFPVAYIVAAAAIFLPMLVLVAFGPQ